MKETTGRVFTLTYDVHKTTKEDLLAIAHSVENALDGHDRLLVLPSTIQFRELSTDELMEISMQIDNILETRRT